MLAFGVCFPQPQPVRAVAAGLPRQDHVRITANHFVRFHNDEFDKMLCKLDSTEFATSFEQIQSCLKTR